MDELKDVFKIVKLEPFTKDYTSLNARGGLYHRINGKSTASGKERPLTANDKEQIKAGLKTMICDIEAVIEKI